MLDLDTLGYFLYMQEQDKEYERQHAPQVPPSFTPQDEAAEELTTIEKD